MFLNCLDRTKFFNYKTHSIRFSSKNKQPLKKLLMGVFVRILNEFLKTTKILSFIFSNVFSTVCYCKESTVFVLFKSSIFILFNFNMHNNLKHT